MFDIAKVDNGAIKKRVLGSDAERLVLVKFYVYQAPAVTNVLNYLLAIPLHRFASGLAGHVSPILDSQSRPEPVPSCLGFESSLHRR